VGGGEGGGGEEGGVGGGLHTEPSLVFGDGRRWRRNTPDRSLVNAWGLYAQLNVFFHNREWGLRTTTHGISRCIPERGRLFPQSTGMAS